MGMYALGFPVGLLVDNGGPRVAVVIGMLLLACGYFPLHEAYDLGFGSVPLFCFFSSLTGLGGCMAFQGAIKISALNWPHHRGSATAFPLAAFGLSAFFFSTLGAIFFPGDTSGFLMLLASGTSGVILIGSFFLRVIPYPYQAVPTVTGSHLGASSNARTGPAYSSLLEPEIGTSPYTAAPVASSSESPPKDIGDIHPTTHGLEASAPYTMADDTLASETSSLLSKATSLPGEIPVQSSVGMARLHRVDIRGLRLFPLLRFWQLFALLGVLSGVGLMTIKYAHSLRPPILSLTLTLSPQQRWKRRQSSLASLRRLGR